MRVVLNRPKLGLMKGLAVGAAAIAALSWPGIASAQSITEYPIPVGGGGAQTVAFSF